MKYKSKQKEVKKEMSDLQINGNSNDIHLNNL